MSDWFVTPWIAASRLPCPSLSPRVCSDSCPLSQWWHPTKPSHFLLPYSPFAFNLSQHQGLIQWISFLHQVAKVLKLQLQCQSFQWYSALISFRIDWFDLLAVQFSSTTIQKHQFFGAQPTFEPLAKADSNLYLFRNL